MKKCPHCDSVAVPPFGPKDAEILIIGEFPGNVEMARGKPLVGPTGAILRDELNLVGIDIRSCRLANMWIHPPNKIQECKDLSLRVMLKELSGRKALLLLGSDTAWYFTKHKVTDICGLRVEDLIEFATVPLAICAPNPASLFQITSTVGEMRLALKKFVEYMEVM